MVYFENARGEKKYPGRYNDPTPPGYERRELTTTHDVRKFQRVMDTESRIEHEVHESKCAEMEENWRKTRRERMFSKLNAMGASQAGIDFAKMAVERNDSKPKKKYNPGNYIAPFENDASNVRAQSLESK